MNPVNLVLGSVLFASGYISELIVGPIFSIVAQNYNGVPDIVKNNITLNSGFWYGMSWIGQTVTFAGLIMFIFGIGSSNIGLIAGGIITLCAGVLTAISFRTTAVTIPLFTMN